MIELTYIVGYGMINDKVGISINILEGKGENIQSVVLKTQVEDLFPIGLILTSDLQ